MIVTLADILGEEYRPDIVERVDNGTGNYASWLGTVDLETIKFKPPKEKVKGSTARGVEIRVRELRRLEQMRRERFEAGKKDLENWGYGEGKRYRAPLGEGETAGQTLVSAYGKRMALADMGYTGPGITNWPKRRCVNRMGGTRCLAEAVPRRTQCQRHIDRIIYYWLPRYHKAFLIQFSMKYKGVLANRAIDMLDVENPLSLKEELALQRLILQEALEYIELEKREKGRDNMIPVEMKLVRTQVDAISQLIKQIVDVETKVAYAARDIELLNSRIVQGVFKFVPPEHRDSFMDFISGTGIESAGQLTAAEIQAGESEEGASTDIST